MIAPCDGGWIKIQNGVPVISRSDVLQAIADAEIFNVEKTKEDPVANEITLWRIAMSPDDYRG